MTDPTLIVAIASTGTAAVAAAAATGLKGWQGWLELKRLELDRRGLRTDPGAPEDLGALRRRVGRLEAIANGLEN
jgi:hypothetical protein